MLLITGGTGFIGHYLIAELLRRGIRCAALVRPPLASSTERLLRDLAGTGVDGEARVRDGELIVVEGDLAEVWPDASIGITGIVHGAASTRFTPDGEGEPWRTNVDGTRRMLEWAADRGVAELHLISSAYACGRAHGPVVEGFHETSPTFHNTYEESKWQAEMLCREWAARPGRRLTVYRPSVVVGDYGSGRATKFSGLYLLARATELLDRTFREADAAVRRAIPLRIRGRAQDCQNIVPVDYVAAMMARLVADVRFHGRVYHLTHPSPPTNLQIKRALESYFDIGGGRFVEPDAFPADGLNEHEQRFYEISRSIEHYLVDTPTFVRDNTVAAEREFGMRCRAFDEAAIHRLISFAQSCEWGRRRTSRRGEASPCAAYFRSFLPRFVEQSRIARLTAVTTTMRFVIDDEPDGQWVCCFDRGQLRTVHRGSNGLAEEFGYRSTREVFWEAIAGATHPQELFLSGRAELFGDVEKAMKMAMILHEFTKEFPCTPRVLADLQRGGAETKP